MRPNLPAELNSGQVTSRVFYKSEGARTFVFTSEPEIDMAFCGKMNDSIGLILSDY
jgi:hypothetical protein